MGLTIDFKKYIYRVDNSNIKDDPSINGYRNKNNSISFEPGKFHVPEVNSMYIF